MSTLTLKISTLYAACSPELGVVSYGCCQDEALNNLAHEIRIRESAEHGRGKQAAPELAREGEGEAMAKTTKQSIWGCRWC